MHSASQEPIYPNKLLLDTFNQQREPILIQDAQQGPYSYDDRGHFLMRIGNNCAAPCQSQTVFFPQPLIQLMPVQCMQAPAKKKKAVNTKELE